MDGITAWITPALLIALFAWLRFDVCEQRREVCDDIRNLNKRFDERLDGMSKQFNERLDGMNKQFDERLDGMNKRFDELNKQFNDRFDQVQQGLGDLRERMARLEGALEGFLAGRRDRDAA